MVCRKIEVNNFRNIENADITFSDGVNVLVGNNAQGKTNLLEGIYLFALGKSFRSAHEADMIKFGESASSLSLDYTEISREMMQNLSMRLSRDRRRLVTHNKVKITRLSEMIGCFRAVLFCPEHLSLIKEGPSLRRNFLDVAVSQFRPVYLKSLQRYNNVLEQRNKVLKNAFSDREALETIDIWSAQLAHEAAVISSFRWKYVETVSDTVAEIFSDMTSSGEIPTLAYNGSSKQTPEEYSDTALTEQKYIKLLTENLDREIAVGSTLWGVHKDDIEIMLNGKSARLFASQGQQRSLALAMKLSEGEICYKETGDYPVLLLDDVMSELDAKRREYLLGSLGGRQVIITTCEKNDCNCYVKNAIEVENGTYRKNG